MTIMMKLNKKYQGKMLLNQTQLTNKSTKQNVYKHIKGLSSFCNYFVKVVILKEKDLCRINKNKLEYSLLLWQLNKLEISSKLSDIK